MVANIGSVAASLVAASAALLAAGAGHAAQNRATLKVPDGLSFSEFTGYEAWQPVAVSQTGHGLKLISANPAMMAAYRRGLPAKGRQFPEGSKAVKIEWAPAPNKVSQYPVNVPGALVSLSFIEKDSKRFPKTGGWGYAKFVYDPKSSRLAPEGSGADCGHQCHIAVAAQDYIFTAYPVR